MPLYKTVLFLMLLLLQPLAAQDPGDLNLSSEQQQQIDAVHRQYSSQRAALESQLKSKKFELMRGLRASHPDERRVKQVLADIMGLEHQRQNLFVDEMFECRAKLTPQQWEVYLRSMLQIMMSKH